MTDVAATLRLQDGLKSIVAGFCILFRRPRLLRWLVPPLLITLLLDALAFYFVYGWLRTGIRSIVQGDGSMSWVRVSLDVIGGTALLFALGWTFAWLFLIVTSPFQDFISAEVEQELAGKTIAPPSGFPGFLRGVVQSLLQAIVISLLTLLVLIAGAIPLIGPVLVFCWSAFALGYSFIAIPSGRMAHRIGLRAAFARRHRAAVFGLGLVVAGATFIPLVNVLLMPVFVVAGTILYVEGKLNALQAGNADEKRSHQVL